MAIYTFKRYTWSDYEANDDSGLAVAGVEWDAYMAGTEEDWDALLTQADWHGTEETGIGALTREWNGHPKGALIISDGSRPGLLFAVSNEAFE